MQVSPPTRRPSVDGPGSGTPTCAPFSLRVMCSAPAVSVLLVPLSTRTHCETGLSATRTCQRSSLWQAVDPPPARSPCRSGARRTARKRGALPAGREARVQALEAAVCGGGVGKRSLCAALLPRRWFPITAGLGITELALFSRCTLPDACSACVAMVAFTATRRQATPFSSGVGSMQENQVPGPVHLPGLLPSSHG